MGLASDDRPSAFTCDPGSPRTVVLGHSQSSLRDWSRREMTPRTNVLGYSQPSLRDWFRYTLIADFVFSERCPRTRRRLRFAAVKSGLDQDPRYSEAGQKP